MNPIEAEPDRRKHEQAWNTWNYNRQLRELQTKAEENFWTLEAEDQTNSRFLVKDKWGRILVGASGFSELRGSLLS